MSNIIVKRDFELELNGVTKSGIISILQPVENDSDWVCECVVNIDTYEKSYGIYGVDSWQALQLAIDFAPVALEMSPDVKESIFKMWGEEIEDFLSFFDSNDEENDDEGEEA